MSKALNLLDKRFGRLVVIGQAGRNNHSQCLWACTCDCGCTTSVTTGRLTSGKTKSCGCLRKDSCRQVAQQYNWKGGRYITKKGYVMLHCPNHPNAEKSGYVREHIKIMSDLLGRPLLSGENVHHKNGVRSDNRADNLDLWVSLQPKGQKPEDLVEWAEIILHRYKK